MVAISQPGRFLKRQLQDYHDLGIETGRTHLRYHFGWGQDPTATKDNAIVWVSGCVIPVPTCSDRRHLCVWEV